jgi:ERCC4-related helicase
MICTSVGEERLDIPSADIEVWVDPPSNPQQWIQRFGRVLRQPWGKHQVRVHALISKGTHEKKKLFTVKRNVETVYNVHPTTRTDDAEGDGYPTEEHH